MQRRRKQLGVGGVRSRWPTSDVAPKIIACNAYGRSYTYVYLYIHIRTPAHVIIGHAEIRPSLAPRLARMLEQESVSATLGSQPTLP